MMLPEPDRTFLMGASRTTRSRLALADGDAEEAGSIARQVIGELRSLGVQVLVAEPLVALAKAHLAEDRLEEAGAELLDAIELAERFGERRVLWEALSLRAVLQERSGSGNAADLRRGARAIVDEIAAGLPDANIRARFLAREEIPGLDVSDQEERPR